jgi:hypothetical protein
VPITLQKSNQLKSIAILMMLCLHLFNRDYRGLFQPLIVIGSQPLSYYISLFCDACVPIFAFVSGYGLYFKYVQNPEVYAKANSTRLKKLYINYWIILLLFAVVLGAILGTPGYPGSFLKVLLNLTAVHPSYNGAWWFLTIYILFVLSSGFWFRLLDQLNPYFFITVLLLVYGIAFYFRIYKVAIFENQILQWVHQQSALFFCTLAQFMLGAFALKFQWHSKISQLFNRIRFKNSVALSMIVLLFVFHGFVPNFIVAPFTGLGFIFMFLQLDLPFFFNKLLDFFTPHATNIWLIHMFFYMIFFTDFIYSPKYVLPIFFLLLGCCILSSLVVNRINKWVVNKIKV